MSIILYFINQNNEPLKQFINVPTLKYIYLIYNLQVNRVQIEIVMVVN